MKVTISITDDRDSDGLIYITVATQPGVEVGLAANTSCTDKVHHVSPGVYVGQAIDNDDLDLDITVYGNPITSGDRSIALTFTAQ